MSVVRKLPQSAKIALTGILFAGAVATWYLVAFKPSQQNGVVSAANSSIDSPSSATSGDQAVPSVDSDSSAQHQLEVRALPFLVGQAGGTKNASKTTPKKPAKKNPAESAIPGVVLPPNPFEPLSASLQAQAPVQVAQPQVSQPQAQTAVSIPVASLPTVTPIPSQPKAVSVQQTSSLPKPTLQVRKPKTIKAPTSTKKSSSQAAVPATLTLGDGNMPVTLAPITAAPAPKTVTPKTSTSSTNSSTNNSSSSNSTNTNTSVAPTTPSEPEPVTPPAPVESPLSIEIREKGYSFNAAILGPTSVAVIVDQNGKSNIVQVGKTLPGTKIVLKSLTAKEAVLQMGDDEVTLQINK